MAWYKKPVENLNDLPSRTKQMINIIKLGVKKRDDIDLLMPLIREVNFFKNNKIGDEELSFI